MNTPTQPAVLTAITEDDIEWATEYLEAASKAEGYNALEFAEAEGERLGFDPKVIYEHCQGRGDLAGAVHFGLLLAECQRMRFVLDNYAADVAELKEA
jgi:hypothetical protein